MSDGVPGAEKHPRLPPAPTAQMHLPASYSRFLLPNRLDCQAWGRARLRGADDHRAVGGEAPAHARPLSSQILDDWTGGGFRGLG